MNSKWTRNVTIGIAVVFCTIALMSHAQNIASSDIDGRFARLKAMRTTVSEGKLTAAQKAELIEEVAIERALWEDELARAQAKLEAAKATEGLSRLEGIHSQVQGKLMALEVALTSSGGPDKALIDTILSSGEGETATPSWPIYSGAASQTLPVKALERVEPYISSAPPADYSTPPYEQPGYVDSMVDEEGTGIDPIQTKAAELGNDPIAMYLFVLNTIRAEHYFGSIKPPEIVLSSGTGNDADQAALLAALMRAAGHYSRLAWGVVEIPAAVLENHFGVQGFSRIEQVMTAAGMPWSPVVVGGRPAAYRIERVWCEVWLPFANFRGVILDQSGSTWVPLDPELKTMAAPRLRRIFEEMNLDAETLRSEYLQGQYCGQDLTLPGACPTLREVLSKKVNDYLTAHGESETYESVTSQREIIEQTECVLPTGLVGTVVAVNGHGFVFPDRLLHKVHFRATAGAKVLLDATIPANVLSGRQAVLWFAPATSADEELVKAYNEYLWEVPPYLINVTPVVMAGETELARGIDGLGMGRNFDLTITVTAPGGGSVAFTNGCMTGVPVGFGPTAGRQGWAPPDGEPVNTFEFYAKFTNDYIDDIVLFEGDLAATNGLVLVRPFPSFVTVGSVVDAIGNLGLIQRLELKGFYVDADLWGGRVEGFGEQTNRDWSILTQLEASAQERELFEDYKVTSISADKLFMLAQRSNLPIVHITQGNLESALAGIPYDAEIKDEIRAWVQSGGVCDIPQSPITHLQWTGIGYVLFDPVTGQAKYQLSGAISGGMTAVPYLDGILKSAPGGNWPPTNGGVSRRVWAVSELRIDNRCNKIVGQAGKPGDCKIMICAFDGRKAVIGAIIKAEVVLGDASVGAKGKRSAEAKSDNKGSVKFDFWNGTHTYDGSLYTVLPGHTKATRLGTNVFHIQTTRSPAQATVSEIFAPGPVNGDKTQVVADQGSDDPGLLAGSVVIRAADEYDNPVGNATINYSLSPGDGALLSHHELYDTYLANGTLPTISATGAKATLQNELSQSDGENWANVVLGFPEPDTNSKQYTVSVSIKSKSIQGNTGDVTRSVNMLCNRPPGGKFTASFVPRTNIEAYKLGSTVPRPFVLELFQYNGNTIAPLATKEVKITREEASTNGCSFVRSESVTNFNYSVTLQNDKPGLCFILVDVKRKDDNITVVSISPWAWALRVKFPETTPIIELGRGNVHQGSQIPYTIEPATYPAASTTFVFMEDGKGVGWAENFSRGPGVADVGYGSLFKNPGTGKHEAKIILNRNYCEGVKSSGECVFPLAIESDLQKLMVVNTAVIPRFRLRHDELEISETVEGNQHFFRSFGGARMSVELPEDDDIENLKWQSPSGPFFVRGVGALGCYHPDAPGAGTSVDSGKQYRLCWQGAWAESYDTTLKLAIGLKGGTTINKDLHFVGRKLMDQPASLMDGSDVLILQHLLFQLGTADKGFGVATKGVGRDGVYGPGSQQAMGKVCRWHDVWAAPCYFKSAANYAATIDLSVLEKLKTHLRDYLLGYESFPAHATVNADTPGFLDWVNDAAKMLRSDGNYADSPVTAEVLIREWLKHEGGVYGHWGWIPSKSTVMDREYRITVGSADGAGSIGFSQIQAKYKYVDATTKPELKDFNLYSPHDDVVGFAAYVTNKKIHGSITLAFKDTGWKLSDAFPSFPKIKNPPYQDDTTDLLSKALFHYNRGSSGNVPAGRVWPKALRDYPPISNPENADSCWLNFSSSTNTMQMAGSGICYAIGIKNSAGLDPAKRCWTWIEEAIYSGDDDKCESTLVAPDVAYVPKNGARHQLCIAAKAGESLKSTPAAKDRKASFEFSYCESDYARVVSWAAKRAAELAKINK